MQKKKEQCIFQGKTYFTNFHSENKFITDTDELNQKIKKLYSPFCSLLR